MKLLVLAIFHLLCFNGAELKYIEENELLPRELIEKLIGIEDIADYDQRKGNVGIDIDDYADKIFANVQQLIISRHLNSVHLPDATLKLEPTGKVDLTAGYLQDLETLSRDGVIGITYIPSDRTLTLILPMKFGDLRFSYNFHSKVTFISSHGVVNGTVKNVRVNAQLSFDFKTYQAALDHYDMDDTGDITVKFHGNKIVDWLLDAMTKVFTVFFHPLIVGQIQKLIRDNLRVIATQLNELIHKIIDPTML